MNIRVCRRTANGSRLEQTTDGKPSCGCTTWRARARCRGSPSAARIAIRSGPPMAQRITFQSDRDGDGAIFWQRADRTGGAERLTKPEPGTTHIPDAWSPDGKHLLFSVESGPSLHTLDADACRPDGSAVRRHQIHGAPDAGLLA